MYVCGTNTAVLRIKLASLPSADKKKNTQKNKTNEHQTKPPKKRNQRNLSTYHFIAVQSFSNPNPFLRCAAKLIHLFVYLLSTLFKPFKPNP